MDEKDVRLGDNSLNNVNNPVPGTVKKPESKSPVVNDAGDETTPKEDVLDPEAKNNKTGAVNGTGKTGSKESKPEEPRDEPGEDVLDPEAKKDKGDVSKKKKDKSSENGDVNKNPNDSGTADRGMRNPSESGGTDLSSGRSADNLGRNLSRENNTLGGNNKLRGDNPLGNKMQGDLKSSLGQKTPGMDSKATVAKDIGAKGSGKSGWTAILKNPYVLLVIALIGIIAFLFNMPGLMVGKLKQIAQGLWDGIQSLFITEADAFINDDDVTKLAQYLVDMDYDLIGYGFVRAKEVGAEKTYLELEEEGYRINANGQYVTFDSNGNEIIYDGQYYNALGYLVDNRVVSEVEEDSWFAAEDLIKDKYGIRYWASDGEYDGVSHTRGQIAEVRDGGILDIITGANADDSLLRAYLMADYRITVLRNDDEGLLEDFGDYLNKTFGGAPNAWSKGLIKLYKKEGTEVSNLWFGLTTVWWDDTSIVDNGTKLSIRNGWFNRPMEFELDGWTGRYGLSLEFLLSLHLGTMAPDLVTAMLQCFDTEVQVYCEQVTDSQVLTKYIDYEVDEYEEDLTDNDEEVTIESMNQILDETGYWVNVQDGFFIEWVNSLSLNKRKCLTLLRETGLSSPPGCIYTAVAYVKKYMQPYEENEWPGSIAIAATEEDNYLSFYYGVIDPLLEDFDYKVSELTDECYTAFNSLYSLRNDNQLGWNEDSDTIPVEIETGLNDYVYPDKENAIAEAKEYQMPEEMSVEPSIEYNYTGSSLVSGKARAKDGYVIVNGYVYRIQREIIANEWSLYGYLDDDGEFHIGTEEDFNTDRDGLPWEETTAYLNSYIYRIYQAGYEDDDQMILYGESNTSDRGVLVENIPVTFVYRTDLVDSESVIESIDDEISIYYDDSISTERMAKFRFFDSAGNELQLSYIDYYPTEDYVSVRFGKYFSDNSSGIGEVSIFYNEDSQSYSIVMSDSGMDPYRIMTYEEKYDYYASDEYGKQVTEDFILNGGLNSIQDEFLYDVLYLNFVVRDKTIEELIQCGILESDGNGGYITNEDAGKCSIPVTEGDDITKCCSVCQKYVKGVVKALAQIQDTDYAYYQPYIARVVGSWFRDTYFIIPEEEDGGLSDYYGKGKSPVGSWGSGGSYVKVDEEYLNSTGEYWTDYVMIKVPELDDKGNIKRDENGEPIYIETDEYQLYYLNPDGTTSNTTLEEWLESDDNVNSEGKKYMSQEEAEKDGHVFVKKVKLLSLDEVKENTQKDGDDGGGGRDMEESPYMEGTVWSAYTVGEGGDSGWIKINREEVDNVDKVLDMVDDKGEFYYKLLSTKSIEQEEDAIRTETNVTVKNLFRYRQFYIYDGSRSRAELIQKDRENVIKLIIAYWNGGNRYTKSNALEDLRTNGRYALRSAYGEDTILKTVDDEQLAESWLEYQLDIYYTANFKETVLNDDKFKLDELCEFGVENTYTNEKGESVTYLDSEYYTSEGHSLDPRDRGLIATVNITKSSLDAFSILENVNTLDADYQYRDFKELIVELNYFDKEELSEAVEEVFTWIVPTYTTLWPIQAIDKQNNEYGTLVHSQASIDFLIEVYEKLVEEEKQLNAEPNGENPGNQDSNQENPNAENEETIDMSKVYYIGDSWFEAMKNGSITESPSDYFTTMVGGDARDSVYDNIQVKSDATAIVVMLGLNDPLSQTEMKALIDDLASRYSNKPIYVLKVFHVGRNYTYGDKDTLNANIDTYNNDISEYCSGKSNVEFVDATEGILDEDGYIKSTLEDSEGIHLTSYSALYANIKKAIEESSSGGAESENEQILMQLKEATSYTENAPVISPVTGKIIAYGEHSRINVYTNETETVGYVKIEIMGYGEGKTDSESYFTESMLSGFDLEDEEKEKALKGLNGFYDEYKDNCAGYILTIDGIDITDLKNGFSSITDAEGNAVEYDELCQYEVEEGIALYNSKEQKRREEEAEGKEIAPYLIKYNVNYNKVGDEYFAVDGPGGYYVKEGAYLGKTQSPTDRNPDNVVEQNPDAAQGDLPNLSEDSVLVDENPERILYASQLYDEFLDPDKNPDYLRLILLDKEMTVVDNVEDYFPGFEEGTNGIDDLEDEKFLYWMGVHIEGGDLVERNGKWYSQPVDLGDGAGYTHFFGITSKNNKALAVSLGYTELADESNWAGEIELQTCLDMYLALIEEDKAYIREQLGEDIPDGFLQAFISVKHNYGNLTKRGDEYKRTGTVSESTWTTYEGEQYAEALTNRRKGEWLLITEGIYPVSYGGNFNEIEFPSEDKPFTDWCLEHGITNIQIPDD